MLQTLIMARDEDITRSKAIVAELEDTNITNKKRSELMAELDRLTGNVRRKMIDELLHDVNNLSPFLRGNLKKRVVENYEIEIENKEKVERWKWSIEVVGGRKMMFDPYAENPKYEPIPMMTVERSRHVFICETNRGQVAAIKKLLMDFLSRARATEFQYSAIDKIISEKSAAEAAISKIDRSLMAEERLSEVEFLDATYIKKPARPMVQPADSENDLFRRFDSLKGAV
jgi:hypothetical protein